MLSEGSQFSYCQQITPEMQKLGGGRGVGVGVGCGVGGKKLKIRKIEKKKKNSVRAASVTLRASGLEGLISGR